MRVCRVYGDRGRSTVSLDFDGTVYLLDSVEAVRMAENLLSAAQYAATNKENAE